MSVPHSLGGSTHVGHIIGSSVDCKPTLLVSSSKSSLGLLQSLTDNTTISNSPILGLSDSDNTNPLSSLILALDSSSPKLIDPALDSLLCLLCGPDDPSYSIHSCLFDSLFALNSSAPDDSIELSVLKLFLPALRSEVLLLRADALTTSSTPPPSVVSSPLLSNPPSTHSFSPALSRQAFVS